MNTKGMVIKTTENIATVKVPRSSSCGGSCASCGMCGNNYVIVEAENSIGAKEGQVVTLVSKTFDILMIALITYLLPLIILLSLGIIFKTLSLWAVVASVLAFAGYFFIVKYINLRVKKPRIGQIL
ncbi:MAG: SoxR reducing system RseC family protein [Clostridiales bacterium]|jgi:sigma-E factor negative regulatory protein RseC|nr:SoxR reducing system RseC family protein [Clostridiales bacterium]